MRQISSMMNTSVGFCESKRAGPFGKINRFGSLATGRHCNGWTEFLGFTLDKNIKGMYKSRTGSTRIDSDCLGS